MSGPYDRPDDPDEVTLWAGRLRSWPTPPPAGDDELADETVLSRRDTPDDDTVLSAADVPEGETYVSRRTPGEGSSASLVERAGDETIVSRREAPGEEPSASLVELPDDETIVSRAEVPAGEMSRSRVDLPDDATVVSRREALDDATIATPPTRPALPGRAGPADDEVGTTAPRRATTRPPLDAAVPDEATRSRSTPEAEGVVPDELTRRRSSDPDPLDEATRARPAADVDDETASGSRRRRREAAGERTEPVVEGAVRDARVPAALATESYGPRREAPARVERVAAVRAPSAPDVGTVRPRANRGAGRVIVLVAVVAVVLVASIVGAVLLLTG
ncbi:hypothetical protein [Microbacterium testaceum]|uniref:hypothetical protein n=1 Tax=Microbacterium testaceum TaxID=2033 RepID=UPI002AC70D11|nr:hypothetical protein [Microbacterium testaceum]MDZ5145747.1 hypothetical protein [Microbacterium testaceum]